MLCPSDTPEGEACGLVKNLALMTHITTDEEEGPLIRLIYSLGVEGGSVLTLDIHMLSGSEFYSKNAFLVFLNGLVLGITKEATTFVNSFRSLRRRGRVNEFVSIHKNHHHHTIQIASDGGRVCRPLIIVENGQPKVTDHHILVIHR